MSNNGPKKIEIASAVTVRDDAVCGVVLASGEEISATAKKASPMNEKVTCSTSH